jgi:DNA-binding NtrC family response regulator
MEMKARILYLGQNDDGIHFPPAFKLFKTDDPKEAKRVFLGNLWDGLMVEALLLKHAAASFLKPIYNDYRYETPALTPEILDKKVGGTLLPFCGKGLPLEKEGPTSKWLLDHYKKSSLRLQAGVSPLWASPAMESVIADIQKIARLDLDVLFLGETGAGKDHLARFLHHLSLRRNGPFVTIDCCAIPESLFEAELFGHQKGAYTSANEPRKGRIEQAQGGTCFLNEIGELPLSIQAKLLGVIERKRLVRLGDSKEVPLNVRFVFATNQDVEALVRAKAFREDLFWRIAGIPIEVPPLRRRVEEVPLLAEHFLRRLTQRFGRPMPAFSSSALELLMEHSWPGNVRELIHTMEKLCVLSSDSVIQPDALQGLVPRMKNRVEMPSSCKTTGDEVIEALRACDGNKRAAALRLGVSERTVYRYLKLFQKEPDRGHEFKATKVQQ